MQNRRKNREVRSLWGYLPAIIKFYGIKNEKLAAFIFMVMLGVTFLGNVISLNFVGNISLEFDPQNIEQVFSILRTAFALNAINLITFLITNIIGATYIYAFLRDIRGIPYTFFECIKVTFKKLFKLIILSIITVIAICGGLFIFIVPGIIIYLMFIFANQYMMDQNRSIFQSIKASIDTTNGIKMNIFTVILLFNLLMFIFPNFVSASNGHLVYAFVASFISTIFTLMYNRLISIMYFELEYVYIVDKTENM